MERYVKICHEDLILYVFGGLDSAGRRRVEAAARVDPVLRDELAILRSQDEALRALPMVKPRRDLVAPALALARRRSAPMIFFRVVPVLARAASILLLVGLAWFVWRRPVGTEVARRDPAASSCVPTDMDVDGRIDSMRLALARVRMPPSRMAAWRPAYGGDTRTIQDKMHGLAALCRAPTAPSRVAPGRFLDNRFDRMRERMQEMQSDLEKMDGLLQVKIQIVGKGCMI